MIVHEIIETGFTEPAQEQPVCVNVICRSVGLQGSNAIRTIAQLLISIHASTLNNETFSQSAALMLALMS